MTIEAGPKPNGVRPAAGDATHPKGKPSATQDSGGAFGAILASLDPSQAASASAVDAADAQTDAGVPLGTPSPLRAGVAPSGKDTVLPDASKARSSGKGLDALGLGDPETLTESGSGKKTQAAVTLDALTAAGQPIANPDGAATELPVDAAALLLQSAQWPASPAASSQPVGQNLVAGVAQPAPTGVKPLHPQVKPETAVLHSELEPGAEIAGKSGKMQRDAAAKLAWAGAAVPEPTESASRPESRSLPITPKMTDQALVPIAVAAVASTVVPLRREDQARERSVFRSTVTEGPGLGQPVLSTTASTSVQYTPDLQMSPDVFVAEKVAYWISSDVQNAEMKLDGIGVDPVEVSIRMHGNEAHVAFRTDELQARAALENASAHLKDMLQREGLVLSGVSVGMSGTGGSGDREGKPRQGGRQATIVSVAPARADRGAVAGRVAGGTLDLFV